MPQSQPWYVELDKSAGQWCYQIRMAHPAFPAGLHLATVNGALPDPMPAQVSSAIADVPAMLDALAQWMDDFGSDYTGPHIDATRAILARHGRA